MNLQKNLKIRLNVPLRGLNTGREITFCENGRKLDKYWVNRIKDSKIDNCVTVISSSDSSSEKTKKESPVKIEYEEKPKLIPKLRKEHVDK